MLLEQKVKVKWNNSNKKHYENKGYIFTKIGDEIEVDVKDLSNGSHCRVNIVCDFCGESIFRSYKDYIKRKEKETIKKDCCKNCFSQKQKLIIKEKYSCMNISQIEEIKLKKIETCRKRYNCDNPMQSDIIKDKLRNYYLEHFGVTHSMKLESSKQKYKNTMIERYGVDSPLKVEKFKSKLIETNLSKFGVPFSFMSKEIQDKARETLKNNYNVNNPMESKIIKDKIHTTNLAKYGFITPAKNEEVKKKISTTYQNKSQEEIQNIVSKREQTVLKKYKVKHVMYVDEIKSKVESTNLKRYNSPNVFGNYDIQCKIRETLFKNNKVSTSKQQIYLNNLLNGILNFPVGNCSLDILLKNYIFVEYSGGGHCLEITLGTKTEKEFLQKEIRRNKFLKSQGYKLIEIISVKDYLPSDKVIYQMIRLAKKFFSKTSRTWIKFDIDNSKILYKNNSINYNFGQLRKIKKTDLQETA